MVDVVATAGERVAGAERILPVSSNEAWLELQQEQEETDAVIRAISGRRHEHGQTLQTARAARDGYLRDFRHTLANPQEHPNVLEQQKIIDKAISQLERLTARLEEVKRRDAGGLVHAIRAYLGRVPRDRCPLQPFAGPRPTLQKGESYTGAVEQRRRRVRELQADAEKVKVAPVHSSIAKAEVRAQIEALAERGRPNFFNVVEYGEKLAWPNETVRVEAAGAGGFVTIPATLAVLAFVHRDALIAAAEAGIDEFADDKEAMSAEQRAAKLAQIASDLLAVEREEAAFVQQSRGEGAHIAHRADIDPRAVLGLADDAPAPLKAFPGRG